MLGSRSATFGSRRASAGAANEASRPAILAAKRRRERDRRRRVTATESTEIASSVPTPAAPASMGKGGLPKPANRLVPRGSRRRRRWAGRAHRLAGGRTDRCDGIAGQDDAAWVVDRDDEPVCRGLDPPDRVQRIVGLDQRQELESGTAEHDPADRGPVIEREAIGAEGRRRGRRRGPACPRTARGRRGRRRRPLTRRRWPMPSPTVVALPFGAAAVATAPAGCPDPGCPDTCTSAGKRGVTANR